MEDYELMDAYLTNIKHTLEHADELRHQMKKELINQQYIGNKSNIKHQTEGFRLFIWVNGNI